MTDQLATITLVGAGVAVNAVYQVAKDRDPFPTIFFGSLWMGTCVFITTAEPGLGVTLAAVYLLAVLTTRGMPFINWFLTATDALTKSANQSVKERKRKVH